MSGQPERCGECGGTGEVEDDGTGALGYVVKRRCTSCPPLTFERHHHPMVSPDFRLESMHPADEPFWMIGSPYETDTGNSPFLLDRAGMYELIEQCQKALGTYYAKFPLDPTDADVDQMRPGRPKVRPPVRPEVPVPQE